MTSDPWVLDDEYALQRESVWIWQIHDDRWIVDRRKPTPGLVASNRCYATQEDAFHGLIAKFERMKVEIDERIASVRVAINN
jgi:hypothetical protein